MVNINGTEAQTITSPQGASPLAGEGENRPTTHDEIEFFHNILTEARKPMDKEKDVANVKPADTAIRVIRGEVSVAIELWNYDGTETTDCFKTIFLAPERAKALGLDLVDAANTFLN